MNIRSKLMISYLLLTIFSVSVLGFLISKKSQEILFKELTQKSENIAELINTTVNVRNDLLSEKISSDLYFAEKLLSSSGEFVLNDTTKVKVGDYEISSLYTGNTNLTLNNTLVDDIKKSTGAITSVFLLEHEKLIRISTNVMSGGKRATGTYLENNSAIYKKILSNQPYFGNSLVEGNWLITGYTPILDKNQKVIGAIALGYNQINPHLEETLNDIKIGKTGYVYIINSKGDILLHPRFKGSNVLHYDFTKEIIQNKNGIIEYTFYMVHKLAAYRYFEPWDCYIVVTANYDDFKSSSQAIMSITILVGLIIFMISAFIGSLLVNTFVKPIDKLKQCMEIAGKGDLTIQADITSTDEIGVLSQSFNNLIKENKRLLEETIEYDRLKTDFFSNVSHELKTPLNIIFSTTQLLALYSKDYSDAETNKKINNFINIMKQNCYRLLRLVNNLIDITKIDSGFIDLDLENKNIISVVENVTLSTVEYVESKQRTIIFDTEIEEKIMAFDPEKIERIMLNLISNSVKFTKPEDTIEINIYDNEESIIISVKDTGIGIPKEKQEIIFERFRQVSPLLNRNHEGSGIGLSLVKSLVEMHEGTISVKSEYTKGTEFLIEIPVKLITVEKSIEPQSNLTPQTNVEKIQIEFSDIYS